MHEFIAAKEGLYFVSGSEEEVIDEVSRAREVLLRSSNSRRRGCTIPLPRKRLCGITVAPRMPQDWYSLRTD
jgi:hypothetical protein